MKKINIKKWLVFSLACAALFSARPARAAFAPVSAAFDEYMRDAEAPRYGNRMGGEAAYKAAGRNFGYVPSPLNWSHLDGAVYGTLRRAGRERPRPARAALPARCDLRPSMPAVRDQADFNNCWTYSAMAATESRLIGRGLASSSDIRLSEWYITYYAYNAGDGFVPFSNPSAKPYYLVGGDDWRAVALLGRGTGSLPELDAPTPASHGEVYTPAPRPRKYKLNNAFYLGSGGSREVPLSAARREMIKRAMLEYGAVSVGVYQFSDNDESREDIDRSVFSEDGLSYYTGLEYDGADEIGGAAADFAPNHAVALVGWDDDYPKERFAKDNRPRENGAWIVRNSWGSGWGDAGYYYVSYEEGTLCDGVAYDTSAALLGERMYQYDPLGCVRWFSPYEENEEGNISYFANIFTAAGDDRISSVAFYVPSPGNRYEISVYKDCGGSPVGGSLASATDVDGLVPGYNSVTLAAPVDVAAGTKFSVVVKAAAEAGGYKHVVPVECRVSGYSERAAAARGEGWFSKDGVSFYDMADVDGAGTASVCLKAFGERQHTAEGAAIELTGEVTVDAEAGATAAAAALSAERREKREREVMKALCEERVIGVAADKNVALKGVFAMTVEHAGGPASFAVPLSTELEFLGAPYVILRGNNGGGFSALPAEYLTGKLSFSVGDLNEYFSEAEITVADVRDSVPPDRPSEGGGGGCAAATCASALALLAPLALAGGGRRSRRA